MDLGVDKETIQSVADDLEQGHTALFIIGEARHAPTVIDVFKKFDGKIVQTKRSMMRQKRGCKTLWMQTTTANQMLKDVPKRPTAE